MVGNFGERNAYTETFDAWIERLEVAPDRKIIDKALKALDRILAGESELKELWEESGEFDQWKTSMQALRKRVMR
jgi:hypothetical protein